MGGGLLQLVALGDQDLYLIGNPQITFFKIVHRRHTNFSMEAIQQNISGIISNKESDIFTKISNNGDLVSDMWLDVKLPNLTIPTNENYYNWCNNTGHALIKEIELEIGGQSIDKHNSKFLDIWNELTNHNNDENFNINKHNTLTSFYDNNSIETNNLQLYIPLIFFFNRNKGLSLPLIALQYHDVIIKIKLRSLFHLINSNNEGIDENYIINQMELKFYCNFIFLDVDERRRFAQSPHEYLIEQVQYHYENLSERIKIPFNNPIKEFIWICQSEIVESGIMTGLIDPSQNITTLSTNNPNYVDFTQYNDYFNYQVPYFNENNNIYSTKEFIYNQISYEPFKSCKLKFNGKDRFSFQKASYFRTLSPILSGHKKPLKHIYTYSFSLKPEEHQPSGSCNFSRINNSYIIFENPATKMNLHLYAINYNILRFMNGMCGLIYDS